MSNRQDQGEPHLERKRSATEPSTPAPARADLIANVRQRRPTQRLDGDRGLRQQRRARLERVRVRVADRASGSDPLDGRTSFLLLSWPAPDQRLAQLARGHPLQERGARPVQQDAHVPRPHAGQLRDLRDGVALQLEQHQHPALAFVQPLERIVEVPPALPLLQLLERRIGGGRRLIARVRGSSAATTGAGDGAGDRSRRSSR